MVSVPMGPPPHIFGYEVERSKKLHEMIHNILKDIDQFNWKTFLMGMLSVVCLVVFKNVGKTYPRLKFLRALGPLAVTTFTIALTASLNLDKHGIPIVNFIPKGLPKVTVDEWFPVPDPDKVFMVTISIVIVGFMESIAIVKTLASKHKTRLTPLRS